MPQGVNLSDDALEAISPPDVNIDTATIAPDTRTPNQVRRDGDLRVAIDSGEVVIPQGLASGGALVPQTFGARPTDAEYLASLGVDESNPEFNRMMGFEGSSARPGPGPLADYRAMQQGGSGQIQTGRIQSGGGLGSAVPDRGPNELSMADATALAGGDRQKAYALVVESRLRNEAQAGRQAQGGQGGQVAVQDDPSFAPPDPESMALAKHNNLDLPQNAAQAQLVRLQAQDIQNDQTLGAYTSGMEGALSKMQEAESALEAAGYENLELTGKLGDNWEAYSSSNPDATLQSWLNNKALQNPDFSEEAARHIQQAQVNTQALRDEGISREAQAYAMAVNQYQQYNKMRQDFAMQRGLALSPIGAGAGGAGQPGRGGAQDASVADGADAVLGEKDIEAPGQGNTALAPVSEAESFDDVIPQRPEVPELPGLGSAIFNGVANLFRDPLERQVSADRREQALNTGKAAKDQAIQQWKQATEQRIQQLPPELQEGARRQAERELRRMAPRSWETFNGTLQMTPDGRFIQQ